MNGTNVGHSRQPSSPTLPPNVPKDGLFIKKSVDIMGEQGLEDLTTNYTSQADSAGSVRAFEEYGRTDSVTQETGSEHNATRKRFSADELRRYSIDELTSYDLHPPPPTSDANAEQLASRLFSADHLDLILKDTEHSRRFRSFLERYHPQLAATLVRYLESQKALAAIRYANALAEVVSATRPARSQQPSRSSSVKSNAAVVDTHFQSFSQKAVDELVDEALPAYITYRMITVVTECLVKDITGNNSPFMRDLVQGLAEVYCLSDPNQPDNPLVFASEEFYNTTQYNHEYVIGKNCRFLQGPQTSRAAVKRITNALRNGQEISEILLNYRRDGNSFLNLVMMAPLMDQRGNVRYYVGAQIDITRLLEGGKGLESLKQLLDQEKEAANIAVSTDSKPSLRMLRELGGLLNEEEADIVRQRNVRVRRGSTSSSASTSTRAATSSGRRFIGMEDSDDNLWPAKRYGPEGRLPGVYQNYLLVRPYPSLRIIFTSPALRIPGLSQSKLIDRIGGPQYVREGLMEALAQGSSVTAKVSWLTQNLRSHPTPTSDTASTSGPDQQAPLDSRPRWIHCTPLLGSDSKTGVYMIVMVDKEEITGTLNARQNIVPPVVRSRDLTREAWSHREASAGTSAARFTSTKLYTDYLRREGTVSEDSSYTRRATPNANRVSLEEDIRLGKVNSGLARIGLSDEGRPGSSAAVRQQSRAGNEGNEAEQLELRHAHNVSMGVGPPTPYRKRSPATELDI